MFKGNYLVVLEGDNVKHRAMVIGVIVCMFLVLILNLITYFYSPLNHLMVSSPANLWLFVYLISPFPTSFLIGWISYKALKR